MYDKMMADKGLPPGECDMAKLEKVVEKVKKPSTARCRNRMDINRQEEPDKFS
jgi:hypothetical protein